MRKIQITIEIDEEDYRAYEFEARRAAKSVDLLVEEVVRGLYREMKQEQQEADHPIYFP
ncbi:MAG TPA: hypothetical protein VI942_03020 [Thermoanaerobaculia bacterium]|nr:hypothetical protein [Thermoanaerobaculia bacterium]